VTYLPTGIVHQPPKKGVMGFLQTLIAEERAADRLLSWVVLDWSIHREPVTNAFFARDV
jgi:hypothetical protein